ncbi:MAG: hypothetical protein RRY35_07500, partial [Clostridiales bacterium]
EAQLDLALTGGNVIKQQYVGIVAGIPVVKPERCIRIEACDCDYRLTPDGKIVFFQSGAIAVYYRQIPSLFPLPTSGDVCELAEMLHSLLPLFAASRYWDRESEGDGEESGHGSKWMKYYVEQKARCLKELGVWDNQLDCWQVMP